MKRAASAACWLVPPLVCLSIYWLGLRAWFQADDFAWLDHAFEYHRHPHLLRSLFEPMAQGTVRPWSERAFFLIFYSIFGLNALPFRIWVFLTQFVNLALVVAIATRFTGSRPGGCCAAILWTANVSLAIVMSWTAVYNQALCGLFLLAAFYFLLRFLETGRRCYWIWQWLAFLMGFGALELNVVYPVLAAAYTFLCARKYFPRTLPLFIPSLIFAVVHRLAAPPATGSYAMHFDWSMASGLMVYWNWVLGPAWLAMLVRMPGWLPGTATIVLSAGLLGYVVWNALRRRWLPVFLLAWFVIIIAPLLPLREHRSDYYGYLPAIGLAILGATALVHSWRSRWYWRLAASGLAIIYLAISVPGTLRSTRWMYDRSQRARWLVQGVIRARELHPGKIILLHRVDEALFFAAVVDRPFRLIGISQVYLTPGTESAITATALGDPREFMLPDGTVRRILELNEAVVYEAGRDRLRNITQIYTAGDLPALRTELPRRVDVGSPVFNHLLGPTWYLIDDNHRWMPAQASLRMAAPRAAGERLLVSGLCPPQPGPVYLTVIAGGARFPARQLGPGSYFQEEFTLPAALVGRDSMEVSVEVDRTVRLGRDQRELGLSFGVFEIR